MADPKAGVDTQTPPANPAAPAPDPDSPDPQAPRSYSQEDLDRIVNKVRRNTRREVERAVDRTLAARSQPQPQPEKPAPPAEDAEPKRDDHDDYETYARELAKFEGRKAAREEGAKKDREQKERTERESQDKAARTWHGKIEKAVAKHADFEDVLEDGQATLDAITGAPMRAFITESDIGPEIVYHLCQNPEEVKRIAALPGYKQAAEIAKIEEKLTAAPPKPAGDDDDDANDQEPDPKAGTERNADGTFKPKKEPSKAPDPIEPVGERSANTSTAPSDKDSTAAWMRKRAAEIARRQRK